jgi:SAM-dependent methyltransferase
MPTAEQRSLLEHIRRHVVPGAAVDERDLRAHVVRCERLVAAIEASLPASDRPRVLEVGLGAGYVVAALRRRFGDALELYAVEHPARTLPQGASFAAYLDEHRLAFESADLLEGPLIAFAGVAFDAVVCSEVIEHLPPHALADVLAGLTRRLARDGVLVLSSPNLRSFHRRASLAAGSGRILDLPLRLPEADGTYGHLRLYARSEIEELLRHAGLEVVSWEYVNFEAPFVEGRVLRTLQEVLPRLVVSLSSGWLVVARQEPTVSLRSPPP